MTLLVTINNDRRCEVKYRQIQEVLVDIPERITEHGLSSENTQSSGGSSDASEGSRRTVGSFRIWKIKIPCIESLLAMCLFMRVPKCRRYRKTEKVALRSQETNGVQNLVTQATSLIGCGIMQKPFRYLGVMVGDCMSRKFAWTDTIQKLRSRLSNWKVKTLSVGGRLTLLKSVLGASPLYNMSIYRVPKGVLKEMEAIRSNFFIGADTLEIKIAWVSWDKVLASKKNGGLGVSSFSVKPRSFLLKWVLALPSQDCSHWFSHRLFTLETDKRAFVASKLGLQP
ncbi:hypothetical protein Tco_0497514 [Tanacetum coccineum]